jgi:PAS domain-containing protein
MSSLALAALQDDSLLRQTLDLLPAGAYLCNPDGLITYYNRHALNMWGRAPALNDPADRYCGSFRLFAKNGAHVLHEECWMALAIKNRREYLGQEIVVERADKSRVTVLAYATPLINEQGEVTAAMNIVVNISDRKRIEALLIRASETNDLYRATVADALREQLEPMRRIVESMRGNAAGMTPDLRDLDGHIEQLKILIDEMVDIPRSEA